MEFASFFNSLGTKVTVIEMLDEILGGMDGELSALLRADYAKRGITFLTSTKVTALEGDASSVRVSVENADGASVVEAEKVLLSVGRRPVLKGFGLENLDLEKDERGRLRVDSHMQTSLPGVYACGDLTGCSLLAHTAVREAEVTNPEIAGVGETEESLQRKGIACRTVKLPMAYSGRFVAENEGVNGVCKLILSENGVILGAHVLGNPASEIIVQAGMAISLGLTAEQWARMVFPHPTVGEIFKEVCVEAGH